MNPALVRIALAKAGDAEEAERLSAVERCAQALAAYEATFEERINANKALRGEKPTRLGKRRREELDGYATDLAEIDRELARDFESMASAHEVVRSMVPALRQDLRFWEQAHRHTHAADVPLVDELVDLKRRLLEAAQAFLGTRDDAVTTG